MTVVARGAVAVFVAGVGNAHKATDAIVVGGTTVGYIREISK